MTDTIITAIITFTGTVFTALVVKFIEGFSKSSKIVFFKKGYKFRGEWNLDTGGSTITDEIIVNSTWHGKIKCTGTLNHQASHKSYKLLGKQYGWCIT